MFSNMVRWGGLAGLAAAVVFLVSGILTFISPPQGVPSSFSDYLLEVVVVVAFVLTLLTIAGLHAAQRHSGRYGLLGTVGFWVTLLGSTFSCWWLRTPHPAVGRRAYPARSPPRWRVDGARRLDSVGSHDHQGRGAALMVRATADSLLPPGRLVGQRCCGQREHSVCDSLGIDRLRALVAKGRGSRATLTRKLNFLELRKAEVSQQIIFRALG
jgi:hypothetical protein